jgi:hypothetical protein
VKILILYSSNKFTETLKEKGHLGDQAVDGNVMFNFFNPILFASCTCTLSKWCKSKKGVKSSAQQHTSKSIRFKA